MRGLNKVTLIGHLGKDPEVAYVSENIARARFSLATSESYKDKDGNRVDQTEWHDITLWRKQAEIAEKYLKKGSLIYLEGRLRSRSWEDEQGNKKYATGVEGLNFIMLDKKEEGAGGYGSGNTGSYSQPQQYNSQPQQQSSPAQQPQAQNAGGDSGAEDYNDDLPF